MEIHTRMLRLGLGADDCRTYWAHAGREISVDERVQVAFEERWFGSRTMARVRYLMVNFAHRFDAFPSGLAVLHRWNPADPRERAVLCHWHVQLSDPLYRLFTGELLEQRRVHPDPSIDRTTAIRWVSEQVQGRWSASTCERMAIGLVACATEAGLCTGTGPRRGLAYPRASDQALGYLLHLLRQTRYQGTLRDNLYLRSLGLVDEFWDERVSRLPWLTYRRMAGVHELDWEHPDLQHWADEVLAA